jgi:tetratricopeptide (TPR) repeat protein
LKHYIKLIAILIVASIVLQGFQCSSKEMTTAKVAIKNRDIPKAIENLQKELEKNPKNGEAYILLAELKLTEGDIPNAIALMDKAEPLVANDPKLKDKPIQFKFQIFKSLLERGQEAFNNYYHTKDKKHLETAIQSFRGVVIVRPNFFEAYRRLGLCYEYSENMEEAIKAYKQYVEVIQPSIDIAKEKNFFVGSNTSKLKDIGEVKFLRGAKFSDDGDSSIVEKYTVNGKDLFVMSVAPKGTNDFTVRSWSYDPPKNILEGERELVPDHITAPISSLASLYYVHKKDRETSLEYFRMVSSISPLDDDANSAIVALYQELGRPEEAINAINENVKKNPKNPIFIAQLGDVYMGNKQFDQAIEQYEKALSIDPNFTAALRNVAACYGNKAALIQTEQNEQIGAGKLKDYDTSAYFPLLRKAAENFERVIKTDAFSADPDAIGDLCGIYLVLGKSAKDKFEETLIKLERLESIISENKKEAYYLKLLKIYGQTNNPKYSDIEKKLN